VERSTDTKDCKVTLKTFAHSTDEDGEHWLEALGMVQKELEPEWIAASGAKANDATVLFHAIDRITQHSANAEWKDTVGRKEGMTRSTQTRLPRPGRSSSSASQIIIPE